MKKLSLIAAMTIASIVGSANAADTQTPLVTATIQGVCKFGAPIADVAFGSIDPSIAAGTKTLPLNFSYRCTKGTTPAFAIGTITSMKGTGTTPDTIPFTLGTLPTPVVGAGFVAAATTASVNVSILQADYQIVKADTYTGSVVLSISP